MSRRTLFSKKLDVQRSPEWGILRRARCVQTGRFLLESLPHVRAHVPSRHESPTNARLRVSCSLAAEACIIERVEFCSTNYPMHINHAGTYSNFTQ